jgi:hypothetical protein
MEGYYGILPKEDFPAPGREWTWDMYGVGVVAAQLVVAVTSALDDDTWQSIFTSIQRQAIVARAIAQCQLRAQYTSLADFIGAAADPNHAGNRPSATDAKASIA